MNTRQGLSVLQYNIRKEKNGTMAPLLQAAHEKGIDVLAIQEPWRNPRELTSYCPRGCGYHLAYAPREDTRVCFYINKKLDADKWEVELGSRLATLMLHLGTASQARTVLIHNVYSPSPESQSSTDTPVLDELQELLRSNPDAERIVLGDFNLHHPSWGGPRCLTQHAAANKLLDSTAEADLLPCLPPGTTTWEARQLQTTIDLVFMSSRLHGHLISCGIAEELIQTSDHLPILTRLDLTCEVAAPRKRRAWDKLDHGLFDRVLAQGLRSNQPEEMRTRGGVDAETNRLTLALQQAVEAAVPWASPMGRSRAGWTAECTRIVKDSKRLRRCWQATRHPADWQAYQRAAARRGRTIRKELGTQFRLAIHDATKDPAGIWRLARWGKTRGACTRDPPRFPALLDPDTGSLREDHEDKARILRNAFFPPPLETDLTDLQDCQYPPELEALPQISPDEVRKAIFAPRPDKAPGPDGITNRILRLAYEELAPHLLQLFNACWELGYHPAPFRDAITIALRKPGKADYTQAKSWRPIALLNTMGKALEAIAARRLRYLAEKHSLLPKAQHGARRQRDAVTALELLTEQVHTVWGQGKDKVASLLSLDISGAFDRVSHERLLHNLQKKGIPLSLVNWVRSFLADRTTSMVLGSQTTATRRVLAGIPQGSPVSPILFLFFNMELVEWCARSGYKATAIGFMDDVNILAYSRSTEGNCRTLERVHAGCLAWAVDIVDQDCSCLRSGT